MNPILGPSASPSWTEVPNTPIEYAMGFGATGSTGDQIATSGHVISSWIAKGGSTTSNDGIEVKDNALRPGICINGTPDQIWICATPINSATAKIKAAVVNLSYFD